MHFKTSKIFVADKTGDYVIYDGNEFVRKGEESYCVTTNFLENNRELGNYPCSRYIKANELFTDNNTISVSNFTSILKAVHQDDNDLKGGTVYSLICDLKTGNINLFQFHDFEHSYTLNINEELKKGTRKVRLKNLFPKRISPEIIKTLSKKGAIEAMNKFHDLQKDENYNKSESELIFISKAFYNSNNFIESDEIIKVCLSKYPNSEFALELSAIIKLALGEPKQYIDLFVQSGELDIEFANLLISGEIKKADSLFNRVNGNRELFSERVINTIGYGYLSTNETEVAIKLFKLNTKAFPKSSNAYDSLGEAYMINGEFDLAIVNYNKSLELNPDNDNARKRIKKMK